MFRPIPAVWPTPFTITWTIPPIPAWIDSPGNRPTGWSAPFSTIDPFSTKKPASAEESDTDPSGERSDPVRETINRLSWEENQESTTAATAYRIYRKGSTESDESYAQIAEVTADTFSYDDRFFSSSLAYIYRITALSQGGLESSPVTVGSRKMLKKN